MGPLQFYCRLTEWIGSWFRTTPRDHKESLRFSRILITSLGFVFTWVVCISLLLHKPLLAKEWNPGVQWARSLWSILIVIGSACIMGHWFISMLFWNQRARKLNQGIPTESIYKQAPRWMSWAFAFLYLPAFSIITPVIGVLSIENFYGSYRWHQIRNELSQKGEKLMWEEWLIKDVLPEDDFGSLAIFQEAKHEADLKQGRKSSSTFSLTDGSLMQKLNLPHKHLPRKSRSYYLSSNLADIEEWATAFKTAITNQTERTDNHPNHKSELPIYPKAPEEASSLEVVSTAMTVADELLKEVHEASYRPHLIIYSPDYTVAFAGPGIHFSVIKSMAAYLRFRAMVYLELEKPDAALQDVLCMLRIADLLQSEPLLITHLVRLSIVNAAMDSILSGIAKHQWGVTQLKQLETSIPETEFNKSYLDALRGERAASLGMFASLVQKGTDNQFSPPLMPNMGPLLASGWLRLNQAAHALTFQTWIESMEKIINQQNDFRGLDLNNAWPTESIENRNTFNPHYLLVKQMMASFEKMTEKTLRAQHFLNSTITACTLERYYLKHKTYPSSLQELVPAFLPKVPVDIMDQSGLKYERTDDGSFRLWSIALNGEDNDGDSEKEKDWVWPK